MTYDVSTLYTKLPHDKLNSKLSLIITLLVMLLKEGAKLLLDYLIILEYTGRKKQMGNLVITTVNHLIENCYFIVGKVTLKQAIGIQMGVDHAPSWANLFLYSYEEEYISSLFSSDQIKARYFHLTKPFI